ncbi:outer membrane beta-barrel protein [Novosphingobium sp. KCTC 2891]|uniref:outer membrane protein n=1 Tax=Novosphingobium sp. KCTC 2891 TaxID=2989730 RepID=UPI002223CED1|nr:outer membrane beta-barrel protein [Novosphingobium sp. KCTC 2891]MCW1382906.1 outer membrane beta-barrel protein [Novosphingobium sp. KCTC 2891]
MNKIIAALAAATALTAAVPAFAQDAAGDEIVSPAKNFSGLSVNTVIGWDHLRSGSTKDIDTNADVKQSLNGVVFGGGIGFDVPLGDRLTIGAEGEATTSSARWDNNNGVPNTFNLGRVKAERDLYAGARLGYAMSPKTLLYVKGGYTNARFALEGSGGGLTSSQRLDTDGWRAGAGIEQKLGNHGFGRLEYRYSNYNKGEFDFNGSTPDSSRFKLDTDRHQVVAAVGVRF